MNEGVAASPIGWVGVAFTGLVYFLLFLHPRRGEWRWGRFGHGAPVSFAGRVSLLVLSATIALVAFGLLEGAFLFAAAVAFVGCAIVDSVCRARRPVHQPRKSRTLQRSRNNRQRRA